MPYMFMLARGIHKQVPKQVDLLHVEPFKKALELGVLKKKSVTVSKHMVIQELLRRRNTRKLNSNNKKVDELFEMFDEVLINDQTDINYITECISEYLLDINKAVNEAEDRKKTGGRAEVTDRLRWMMTIDLCGNIREAYTKIQDVLNRELLDARNTEAAGKDFHDLVSEKFNDDSWKPDYTQF